MLQLKDYAVTEAIAKNRSGLSEEKQVAKTKVKAEIDAVELSHTPKDSIRCSRVSSTGVKENQFMQKNGGKIVK